MMQAIPLTQVNSTAIPLKPIERTLVLGRGEIGSSLANVLSSVYSVDSYDITDEKQPASMLVKLQEHYDVIHVCFPYSDTFVESVKKYIRKFKPNLVIIHSTVKPGTTRQLGKIAVHSPVNGKHPHLEESLRTFVKFIGGISPFHTFKAVEHLQKARMVPHVFVSPEATELAKVLCTTQYGIHIVVMREIAKTCEQFNVPFHEIYTEWNNAYNQGYSKFGEMRFFRPILFPIDGPIGGHCVVPNCDLLPGNFLTDLVKERSKQYGKKGNKK